MITCPKCSRRNADDALYCDQCRTGVAPEVQGAVLDEPCPACGGQVHEVPSAVAMCKDCGIFMGPGGHAAEEAEAAPAARRHTAAPAKAPAPAAEPASAGEQERGESAPPCPVCGADNDADALQCGGCGIAFERLRRPIVCPKCSAESTDDTCGCGAVLTLPKLLSYVDDSVQVVCTVCKQLYTVKKDACPDCGGAMRSADGLKDYASSAR